MRTFEGHSYKPYGGGRKEKEKSSPSPLAINFPKASLEIFFLPTRKAFSPRSLYLGNHFNGWKEGLF